MTETSKTVDQALRVLEALGAGGPARTADLARRTGLNRTVAHRLLATLEVRGFVVRDDGVYRVGPTLVTLATAAEPDVGQAARPALEVLAETFGETAVLSVPDGDEAVAIDQVASLRQPVMVRYRPGFRHPLTRAAHGRAILAFLPDVHRVERLLAACDDDGVVAERLAATRARGYAVSHDELEFGAAGLAAPVRDRRGRVIASIGVVAPVGRAPDEAALAAGVLDAAAAVSARLRGG